MPNELEQLNIKLPRDRMAVLRAAVYVRDLGSAKDLVMPMLDELIDGLAADEPIRLALQARAMEQASKGGVVKHLPSRPTVAES